jgi:FkbM family methyltransferase
MPWDLAGFRTRALDKVRPVVNRTGYDVVKVGFKHRFVPALHTHGITAALDIGANTGQFAQLLRRAGFTGRIVSLEPLGDAFAQLSENAARDPRWTVERAAVSDAPGTVTINVAGNSVSSSVLPMAERHAVAAPQSRYVATEQVPATTVDELVARHRLEPARTVLKIDVQGYEQAVLDGAQRTLSEFGAVRVELSLAELYEGQKLMPDMVQYLVSLGLELWHIEPGFSDPVSGRLLQFDGVFVRPISA